MPHAVKVHIRKCPDCGRDEWWMAPKYAAGRTITVYPSLLGSWWWRLIAGLTVPRIGWWWLTKQVEDDVLHGPLTAELPADTARCTNCGTLIDFTQSPG